MFKSKIAISYIAKIVQPQLTQKKCLKNSLVFGNNNVKHIFIAISLENAKMI